MRDSSKIEEIAKLIIISSMNNEVFPVMDYLVNDVLLAYTFLVNNEYLASLGSSVKEGMAHGLKPTEKGINWVNSS